MSRSSHIVSNVDALSTSTRGRWTAPTRRQTAGRARWASALLLAALGLLLVVGLGKFAADAMAAQDDIGASAAADLCAASGLVPLGDTGLCTHGPDPLPPAAAQPDFSGAALAPAISCEGNGVAGNRVQVLYGRSSTGGPLATKLGLIRTAAAAADQIYRDSAAQTDGSRSIRFVHSNLPMGCLIDVKEVILSSAGLANNFTQTVAEIKAAGYQAADRKYLIFVEADAMCGIGTSFPDDRRDGANRNNVGPSYSRVDNALLGARNCWTPHAAAHELMHNFGGVQLTAPNTSNFGHCTDENDVMCYDDDDKAPAMRQICPTADDTRQLDCGHDDYFHTGPTDGSYLDRRWNSANNRFLIGAADQAPAPAPANDDLANAVAASTRPFRDVRREVHSATSPRSDPNPTCTDYSMTQSVWYTTTPTTSGTVTVDTAGTYFKAVVSVWRGTAGSMVEVACGVDLSGNGRSAVGFQATANTTYHVMIASYFTGSGNEVSIKVDGVGEGLPPIDPPALALDRLSSKFGGTVVANLTGFAPNTAVTLTWPRLFVVNPNDPPSTDLLATGTTDDRGSARLTFRTPLESFLAIGYVITARDAEGESATATLRVIPRISLAPTAEGPTTTRLRVYFYGFSPNEKIDVRWHSGPTNASGFVVIKTLTVASTGRASSIVVIPSSSVAGQHKVVGQVVGVARSASTPFTVTAGATSIDDATATPTATAEATAVPTREPVPTETPAPVEEPVATETATPTQEPTPTETPVPTEESTATPVPNASPVAAAGEDQALTDADRTGDEPVALDGGGSTDPEGGPLAYSWTVDGVEVATGVAPSLTLPVGTTTVLLTVTDDLSATATDEIVVVIEPAPVDEG